MVKIGSIIVVILLLIGLWMLLSPTFTKVGETYQKQVDKFKRENEEQQEE